MTAALIAFLTARLDEDELAAKMAAVDDAWDQLRRTIPREPGVLNRCHRLMHAADPARMLREVAAKRAILERHRLAVSAPDSLVSFTRGQDDGYRQACVDAISALAVVYSDHPDYRDKWWLA